jgi:hypothetical protein
VERATVFLFSADSKTEKCFPNVGESLRKSTADLLVITPYEFGLSKGGFDNATSMSFCEKDDCLE